MSAPQSSKRISEERLAQLLLLEHEILTQYVSPEHAPDERDRISAFTELQNSRADAQRMRVALAEILEFDANPQARHVARRGLGLLEPTSTPETRCDVDGFPCDSTERCEKCPAPETSADTPLTASDKFVELFKREPSTPSDLAWINGYATARALVRVERIHARAHETTAQCAPNTITVRCRCGWIGVTGLLAYTPHLDRYSCPECRAPFLPVPASQSKAGDDPHSDLPVEIS